MPERPAVPSPASTPPAPDPARLPHWLPLTPGVVRRLPCGRWFDAVRVPAAVGTRALKLLAGRSGPVINSPRDQALYWLVQTGAADGWRLPLVQVYGTACWLSVPAPTPGDRHVRWLLPPAGDCLTDAEALRAALTRAVAVTGPRPAAGR